METESEFDKHYRRTQSLLARADALLDHILQVLSRMSEPAGTRRRAGAGRRRTKAGRNGSRARA
jgi:hypothetical protein